MTPTDRRNVRVRWAWSAKPHDAATAAGASPAANIRRARPIRRSIWKACGGIPVSARKRRTSSKRLSPATVESSRAKPDRPTVRPGTRELGAPPRAHCHRVAPEGPGGGVGATGRPRRARPPPRRARHRRRAPGARVGAVSAEPGRGTPPIERHAEPARPARPTRRAGPERHRGPCKSNPPVRRPSRCAQPRAPARTALPRQRAVSCHQPRSARRRAR